MPKLEPNMVINWDKGGLEPCFERLLVRFPGPPCEWALIDVYSKTGMPRLEKEDTIQNGFKYGTITDAEDPYEYLRRISDKDLTPAIKLAKDVRWEILESYLRDFEKHPMLFKDTRAKAIDEIFKNAQQEETEKLKTAPKLTKHDRVRVPKLYDWIRQYYQRGQTAFALAPDFRHCGVAGESRGCGDAARGRPPQYGKTVVNITPTIADKLNKGLETFYVEKKYGFADALKKTKEVYFFKRIDNDGPRKIIVIEDYAKWITVGQARHHFLKFKNIPKLTRRRIGGKKYDKDKRGITGDSTSMGWGPGALYMIDATIADCWLRHPWTKQPIGRPTVYLVIDAYSHLVVGFHVTFEPPSMIAAALAIENAIRDKAEVLKELELDSIIPPDLWPAKGIPYALLADRGELISKTSDQIPRELNCMLENTPPYRGDAKGLVEQAFRQSNLHTIQWTDGYISKDRDRDDPVPRKITTVHPRAFCQALVIGIINRNQQWLEDYPLGQSHYEAGIDKRPLELWRWGMAHETGQLRSIATKDVLQKLLPRAEAETTRSGLYFAGVTFTNKRLAEEDWFSLAGIKSRQKVRIVWDPRKVANTYLVPDDLEAELEPLELTAKWSGKDRNFGDLSWRELEALFESNKRKKVAATGDDLHRDINVRAEQERILKGSAEHFKGNKEHPEPSGQNTKDETRHQEVEFGGAGNIPTEPPKDRNPQTAGAVSGQEEDDEERAEIARQLLKSFNN